MTVPAVSALAARSGERSGLLGVAAAGAAASYLTDSRILLPSLLLVSAAQALTSLASP